MTNASPEEQSKLKRRARRRLVGAVALVTVVAVVLPWILEREPEPVEQQIAIQIPPPNGGKAGPASPTSTESGSIGVDGAAVNERAPVGEGSIRLGQTDDALRAEQEKILAPPPRPAVTKTAPVKGREKPVTDVGKKSVGKTEAGVDARSYVVQVAALADAEKAAEMQKAMAAKGLKAYTEKTKSASGEVTRVRVGPFHDRDAAERERGRMKLLGFDGNVVPR